MSFPAVVVTGMGVLASNGLGRDAFWKALAEGHSGIGPVTRFDTSMFPCQIGGELKDFRPEDFMSKSQVKHWHRHVHQAVASARLAVEDSGLASAGYDPERMSCAVGTSVGNPNEAYQWGLDTFEAHGYRKLPKMGSSAFSSHSATVHVSIDFGLRGPAITIASGCATGIDVLGWGLAQIRSGRVDAAVVGATESPLFPMSFATASALGILSKRNETPHQAMRPFDRGSDGIVLSEGAATLVLERADYAQARGAKIYGEAAG
ncbi:MAG TPA: beta-ketoacyl synthase N-terminal-like domain-containing protein, partial [Candidatus Hydrogenedentes bacterium]|nr:beta-ketoacyl synthase N-terminal-like domain-containing protein [Candidatus Hydrogenedentota bacterium]